jgi:hypothetical protein
MIPYSGASSGRKPVPTSSRLPTRSWIDFDAPGRRLRDARENFEQRGFPRVVVTAGNPGAQRGTPDHAHHFAALDFEGDVAQGPEGVVGVFLPRIHTNFTNFWFALRGNSW